MPRSSGLPWEMEAARGALLRSSRRVACRQLEPKVLPRHALLYYGRLLSQQCGNSDRGSGSFLLWTVEDQGKEEALRDVALDFSQSRSWVLEEEILSRRTRCMV